MKYLVLLLSLLGVVLSAPKYCLPEKPCWPSVGEIGRFKTELEEAKAVFLDRDDPKFPNASLTFNFRVARTPALVVEVLNKEAILTVMNFTKTHNIKLSVVSSGHTFLGRAAEDGCLQMSVHYMKDIEIDLNCTEHGCMDVQPGVQWGEAYRMADKYDRVVVGGSNPTVSVSGWTLGGGHSPLTKKFGLAVQNTLSFTIITSDLSIVTANSQGTIKQHFDGSEEKSVDNSLWWALRGGGSAFGVIINIRIKMHASPPGGITQFACSVNAVNFFGQSRFKTIFRATEELIKKLDDTTSGYWVPSNLCNEKKQCAATAPISLVHWGSKDTIAQDQLELMNDFAHKMSLFQPGGCWWRSFKSFYDYEMIIPNTTVTNQYIVGGLIQRNMFYREYIDLLGDMMDEAYMRGATVIMTGVLSDGVNRQMEEGEFAVNIGWKNAIMPMLITTAWDPRLVDGKDGLEILRRYDKNAAKFSQGRYYNEAADDLPLTDYTKTFWGISNYNRLMKIKKQWDPTNMFTCHMCLGAEWDPKTDFQ